MDRRTLLRGLVCSSLAGCLDFRREESEPTTREGTTPSERSTQTQSSTPTSTSDPRIRFKKESGEVSLGDADLTWGGDDILSYGSGELVVFDGTDGSVNWQAGKSHYDYYGAVQIGEKVYASNREQGIVALSFDNGEQIWTDEFGYGRINFSPDESVDGSMLYGENKATVLAIDLRNRERRWTADAFRGKPVSADGVVAVAGDGSVVGLSADDGSELWRRSVNPLGNGIKLRGGEDLFFAAHGTEGPELATRIKAIDPSQGYTVWEKTLELPNFPDLMAAGDSLYVTRGAVVSLDAETGERQWEQTEPTGRSYVVAETEGACYCEFGGGVARISATDGEMLGRFSATEPAGLAVGSGVAFTARAGAGPERTLYCLERSF